MFHAARHWTQHTSATVDGVNISGKKKKKKQIQIKCHCGYFADRQQVRKQMAFFVICCLTWTFYAPSVHVALLPLFNYDNLNLVEWIIEERHDFFLSSTAQKKERETYSISNADKLSHMKIPHYYVYDQDGFFSPLTKTAFLLFYLVPIRAETWGAIQLR